LSVERKEGRKGRALRFGVRVDVVVSRAGIWVLVVRDVVDLPFVEEGLVDDPRGFGDDFVDPAAVADGFAAGGT
jgi:hypothetical protein